MYYICTNNKKLALHTDFMSKLFTLMILLFIGGSSFAQRHELGIRVGGHGSRRRYWKDKLSTDFCFDTQNI